MAETRKHDPFLANIEEIIEEEVPFIKLSYVVQNYYKELLYHLCQDINTFLKIGIQLSRLFSSKAIIISEYFELE